MEVENKPFECPNEDCSLSFANEDHLVVHKKKHQLSLTLTPTTPYKTLFAIDQTPTPTRFLNALDSADLFQDLNADNPFDATFRKANSGGIGSPNFVIPDTSSLIASLPDTSEVLNTPSITLPSEPATPIILKTDFSKIKARKEQSSQPSSQNTQPFTPINQSSLDKIPSQAKSPANTITDFNAVVEDNQISILKESSPKLNVVQTPVITSVGSITVPKSNATCVPTAVVTRQVTNVAATPTQVSVLTEKPSQAKVVQQSQAAVVQSMCVTPMLQLMIRLPDGQTMPVQFPVMSSAQAPAAVTQPALPAQTALPTQPVAAPVDPAIPAANALTKMKLKDMLQINKKTVTLAKKNQPVNSKVNFQSNLDQSSQDLFNGYGLSPPPSPVAIAVQKPGHSGRKRRDVVDSIDEKRRRSLERNRAAATRCREKRKQWITALEKKADELSVTNTHLQQEVAILRNEVNHLKTLLLAHKDCPVTQQQKGIIFDPKDYTTVQIITPDDIQCVPSSSGVSPTQNTEYMEMEMSSVQSSSDLSLTSDGSEISFKER